MGVPQHHLDIGPAAELHEQAQIRAGHDVPAGPGVAQIVPGDVGAADGGGGFVPCLGGGVVHGFAAIREAPAQVFAALFVQHLQGVVVEGYGDGAAVFGVGTIDPAHAAIAVDAGPFEMCGVLAAQAGHQGKPGQLAQMGRQQGQQGLRFGLGEPAVVGLGGVCPGDDGDGRQPAFACGVAQDAAGDGQVFVDGGGGEVVAPQRHGPSVERWGGDVGEFYAGEFGRDAPEAEPIGFSAALGAGVVVPPGEGGFIEAGGVFAEFLHAPKFSTTAVVVFLRRLPVGCASRLFNFAAADGPLTLPVDAAFAFVEGHAWLLR